MKARRAAAEALGTAMLLAGVVGSGIMGERLAAGNVALALLANSLATGTLLAVLIAVVGPVSGAHLNPAVSLAAAVGRELSWAELPTYVVAQIAGAVAGVVIAHAMFALPLVSWSRHARTGMGQELGEVVATFGLVLTIAALGRRRTTAVPWAVGAYVAAAYWFTASTSFANPAVTIARAASDTFAGIRPVDVPGFVCAQVVGAALAVAASRWLFADVAP